MKDLRLYDIMDFALDEDFIRWVHEKNSTDNTFWENWLQQNPSKLLIVAEAKQIVESIRMEQPPLPPGEIKSEINKLLVTIRDDQSHSSLPTRPFSRKWIRLTAVAAAAAVLLLIISVFLFPTVKKGHSDIYSYSTPSSSPSFVERTNHSDTILPLLLPDGSSVELAAGSTISYPGSFNKATARDVYLSGEAFFKIARNPAHPFRVFTHEIVTKVLGTSFSIRSLEKDTAIRIIVRTGRVSVYPRETSDGSADAVSTRPAGIIVSCNQQLLYERGHRQFQKQLVEKPLFIVPDSALHSMAYEDTPVEQVFNQLGKYYGINIVYDTEILSRCTITADLAGEPFYSKLDLICRAIGASYEIVDGQVVIQSNGCR